MAPGLPTPWTTNVLGVLGDCTYCLPSVLCPSVAYYSTSELFEVPPAGLAESCAGGYCICFGFLIRSRLRSRYNLDGSLIGDFIAHVACHCLALARNWREADIQKRKEDNTKSQDQMRQQHSHCVTAHPLPQTFVPHVAPHQFTNQPYLPGGVSGLGIGYYDGGMIQHNHPVQVTAHHNRGNTIDTDLSQFEDVESQGIENNLHRENSRDPPPSINESDPWGPINGTMASRMETDPFAVPRLSTPVLTSGDSPRGEQRDSAKEPISREEYLKYLNETIADTSAPQAVTPKATPDSELRPRLSSSEDLKSNVNDTNTCTFKERLIRLRLDTVLSAEHSLENPGVTDQILMEQEENVKQKNDGDRDEVGGVDSSHPLLQTLVEAKRRQS